jgi:predicted PurR-regulated permease PerM
VVLSFVLAPAVRGLQRLGLPQAAAVPLVVLVAFGAVAGLTVVLGGQLAGLGADLPRYQGTIRDKLAALGTAGGDGTFSRAIKAFEEIGADFARLGGAPKPEAGGEGRPLPVVVRDSGGLLGTVGGVVSPLLHPLATAGLVLVFVIFVLAAREDLRNRLVRLVGEEDIQHTTAVIDDAARRLSRLFLMQLAVNTAFGVVIGIGLWIIGVPSPVLWGALAGVMRFVPYVGAVVGAVPPLALAFAVDPGWSMLIWTALLFVIVEPLLGHVLEPLLFGHSTGLSPVAVVLAATVWTFLWGPIGLVLATPLTVCLVVLGRHVGGLAFLDVMLGDRPALSPQQIFYQRMLAGDPTEAILQAREFLRERALVTYYDEVALEALRLAHEDVARARLTRDRQEVLQASTGALIARIDAGVPDPRPKGGQVGAEAAAAVLAVGPDRGAATQVLARDDLRPDWRGEAPVVCFARAGTLDEVIARMLSQVLTKHGVPARTLTDRDDPAALPSGVRMVCLSYVEPLSTLHLRHAVRAARRACPGARVLVGIWRDRDPGMARALGRAARADSVTPTIGAALSEVLDAARSKPVSKVVPAPARRRALAS